MSWIADPRLDPMLDELLELPPAERVPALDRLAPTDRELRRVLRRVLAETESEEFLTLGWDGGPLWRDLRARLVPAAALDVGDELGSWRVVGELGRGGMGAVYLAERHDGQFDQRVAIKVLESSPAPFASQLFERERRILATLDHPGIARLLDGGMTPEGLPYYVMEHVEGEPVDTYCEMRRLSLEQRLELFCQITEAVNAAHRALVVHRDLKPANILIHRDGRVKLLDFGIASLSSPSEAGGPSEAEGETGGEDPELRAMTPRWASPEQIEGAPVTTASDVYQLGLLLRHLLQAAGASRLPRDLEAILAKACDIDPTGRYGSVAELREDVVRHLHRYPVRARPARLSYVTGRFAHRHWLAVSAAAGAAALLSGLVVFYTTRLRGEREAARREAARASETAAFLQSLFEGADPRNTGGEEPTVRDILDRGSARITSELAEDPVLGAQMTGLLGTIYTALGDHESARRHLETALAERRELLGEEHAATAISLRDLARLDYKEGHYEDAERRMRQALRIQTSVYGDRHRTTAIAHKDLGTVLFARGDLPGARRETETAMAIIEALPGPPQADAIEIMAAEGYVLLRAGEFESSRALLERALALGREVLGSRHPDLAYLLDYAALAERQTGNLERATELAQEALELRREVLGENHPQTLESLHNVGLMLERSGELEQAEALLRQAVAGRRAVLGPDHRLLALSTYSLAGVLEETGRLDEASRLFSETLAIQQRSLGDAHWEVGRTLARLGEIDLKQDAPPGAEQRLRRSLQLLEQNLPPEHVELARPLLWLGWTLVQTGRVRESEALLRRALELRRKTLPAGAPQIAEVEVALGACLADQERTDEARDLLERAVPIVLSALSARPESDWLARQARAALARLDEGADNGAPIPPSPGSSP